MTERLSAGDKTARIGTEEKRGLHTPPVCVVQRGTQLPDQSIQCDNIDTRRLVLLRHFERGLEFAETVSDGLIRLCSPDGLDRAANQQVRSEARRIRHSIRAIAIPFSPATE